MLIRPGFAQDSTSARIVLRGPRLKTLATRAATSHCGQGFQPWLQQPPARNVDAHTTRIRARFDIRANRVTGAKVENLGHKGGDLTLWPRFSTLAAAAASPQRRCSYDQDSRKIRHPRESCYGGQG